MPGLIDFDDEGFLGDIDFSVKYRDKKESSGKKRLKARRKIEDIRDKRLLKRQLDPYGIDY